MRKLSNSEMAVARQCPRKWWLSYFRQLQPREEDMIGPRPTGVIIHAGLEAYYRDDQSEKSLWSTIEEIAAECLDKVPEEHDDTRARITKQMELIRIMLQGYLEWVAIEGVDAPLVFIAAEQKISAPLNDRFMLTAKLDAVVYNGETDSKSFIDHKSVQSFDPGLTLLQLDTQMLTYQLLLRLINPHDAEPVTSGIYNMLRRVKRTKAARPPFYLRESIYHNDDELRNHWNHVLSIADRIAGWEDRLTTGADHHGVVPPNPTSACSWSCPFFQVCPMFDDGSAVEIALEAAYVTGDPYERYEKKGT